MTDTRPTEQPDARESPRAAQAPDFDAVREAARRIDGLATRTPVLRSREADDLTGAQLFFKCENLQKIGAFKFRGACNAISRMSGAQRRRGVVAYSSGNHAQAIALAGKLLDCPATIVMPSDAPPLKLAGTRSHGATVVLYDRYREDRDAIARQIAAREGRVVIPPFDHVDVIAGQGTAALELFEDCGALDMLFVCVGGGGLIAGSALAAAGLAPGCRVIGVEPAAGNDVQQSMTAGHPVRIAVPRTLADGAQTTCVGSLTFPVIRAHVHRIETVSDAALVRTMRWFAERMKLIVEPTGCLGAAAVLEKIVPVQGLRVGVIISGGNVDLAWFSKLLADPAHAG